MTETALYFDYKKGGGSQKIQQQFLLSVKDSVPPSRAFTTQKFCEFLPRLAGSR